MSNTDLIMGIVCIFVDASIAERFGIEPVEGALLAWSVFTMGLYYRFLLRGHSL